ncbi:MAG: PAS domain S-box protein [Anaerolineae bacterium]|nr:PAS domain S-box protein [Anaerolineae bacterium]
MRKHLSPSPPAAQTLPSEETDWRVLLERLPAIFYATDERTTGGVTYISPQIARLGYTPEEWLADPDSFVKALHPEDLERVLSALARMRAEGKPQTLEYRLVGKDGQTVWFRDECVLRYDENGQPIGLEGVLLDITDQKEAKHKAAHLSLLHAVLLRASQSIARCRDPEELLENICRTLVEESAVCMCWVGLYDPLEDELSLAAAAGGVCLQHADRQQMLAFLLPPAQAAIASGETLVCNDLRDEEAQWAREAAERSGRSLAVFPLCMENTVRGVLALYAAEAYFFDREHVQLFTDLAQSVALALENIRNEAEHRQAEIALRLSEEKHRLLFETMTQGVVYQDEDGFIFSANPAAEEILGLTLEQMQGRTSFDPRWHAIHEDGSDFPGNEHPAMVALRSGRPVRDVVMGVFNPQSNSYRWINIHAVPLFRQGESRPYQVYTVFEDITARRHAEEALRESEERLRGVVEQSADGIVITDAHGIIITWNAAQERLTGIPAAEALGRPIWEVQYEAALEEDKAPQRLEDLKGMIAAFLESGRAPWAGRVSEIRFRRRDGQVRIMQSVTFGIHCRGGWMLCSIARDVSEQKMADERLELQSAALEAAASGIVITDRDGVIQWVNPAFCRLTGYSWGEVIGQNPRILQSGRHSKAFYEQMWNTILGGKEWRGELINRRKNGQLYVEQAIITPVKDFNGQVTHFIGIKEEITERKQREKELQAAAALSQALRAGLSQAETLQAIITQMMKATQSDGGSLVVFDPHSGDGRVEAAVGVLAHVQGKIIPRGMGISGYVAQSGKPYRSVDPVHDPLLYLPQIPQDMRSLLCLPLVAQQKTIGTVLVVSRGALEEAEERLLNLMADTAAGVIQRTLLQTQTERRLARLTTLRAMDEVISGTLELKLLLNLLLEHILGELKIDAAGVLLENRYTHILEFAAARGFRTDMPVKLRLRVGEGGTAKMFFERAPIYAPDLEPLLEGWAHPELVRGEGFVSYYGLPLVSKGRVIGLLELFHRSRLEADSEWIGFLETLAGQLAIAIENALLFEDLQRSNLELSLAYDDTIAGWSQALDLRDRETEGHTQRVTDLTLALATVMGVRGDDLIHIRRGALLHDIGKMGIPDAILLKPGALDEREWEIMRHHPIYAYQMLLPISYLRHALDIPYCHHEKWDGTGYPRGLKENEIPLAARIFAVADVWDALTSNRPYRKAWSRQQALEYIRQQTGKHFDPLVVDAFLSHIQRWEEM